MALRMTAYEHCTPLAAARSRKSWLGRVAARLDLARSRRELGALEPHRLRDIGLTAQDAATEAGKGFWDAPQHWR